MKLFLILSLLLFACSSKTVEITTSQTTEDVEFYLDKNGDIVSWRTRSQIRQEWATMLARGTTIITGLTLIDSLYNYVFERKIKTVDGQVFVVDPKGMNFRQHGASEDSIKKAWDSPKFTIRDSLNKIWTKINAIPTLVDSFTSDNWQDDWGDTNLVDQKWWGKQGRKKGIVFKLKDYPISKLDSIVNDSVKWGIDIVAIIRDSVIVCGESFNTLTVRDLNQCVSVPTKLKQGFVNKILPHLSDGLDTTVWVILRDFRGIIPFDFLKHKLFRKKMKSEWINRKLS